MTILGSGWLVPTPRVDEDTQRQIDVDGLRYEQLIATVDALRAALLQMPAPVVNVSEPDLSAVVNAVNSLRPGATADEIGEAIVARLGGSDGPRMEPVLAELVAALETLDFRLKGLGQSGGGGPSTVSLSDATIAALSGGGGTGGLTNAELRATPVPVSGTVSTGLLQPLTDTQLRASAVPISGTVTANTGLAPLTDTQLRATPVPVSGTVSTGLSQPLTDTQIRAAPVPVSGTVTATGPLTDTQLRASAVPVTGSGTAGTPAAGVQTVQGISGGKALPVARTIDGSRTRVSINYNSSTPAVADTLLTVSLNKGGTVTSVTTVPVTAGKVFRVTSVVVGLRTTVATLPFGVVTLRINDSGAAILASPAVYQVPVSGTAAAIGNTGTTVASVEDGLELSGTAQLGVSFSNNLITNVASISIIGYEYTP